MNTVGSRGDTAPHKAALHHTALHHTAQDHARGTTASPAAGLVRVLALDTTTEVMSVAVGDAQLARTSNEAGGAQASARLIPLALNLLASAAWRLDQIDLIAFARGPGAFTGLRTAAAVAQGLALGLDRRVLPLDSLMVVAEDARLHADVAATAAIGDGGLVWVAMDARMGQIYAAAYRWSTEGGQWQEAQEPALLTPDELLDRWASAPPTVLAGSAPAAMADKLPMPSPTLVVAEVRDRAAALISLARQRLAVDAWLDAEQAVPLYLRDNVALTTAERALTPMTVDQLDEVVLVEQGSYPYPWTRGNFVDSIAGGHWAQVRRGADGRLQGYIVAMAGVDELHLLNVTVANAHRRRGLARSLIAALLERCAQTQAATLWLEVRPSNQPAIALYQQLGFVERGRRKGYYPEARGAREDALVMSLDVAAARAGKLCVSLNRIEDDGKATASMSTGTGAGAATTGGPQHAA